LACAVQLAVQLVPHFVVQSSVGGTVVHDVSQWSSQQAPHEAWQSVWLELVVQLELQPAWQPVLQFVVQSTEAGFAVQLVVQSLTQLDVQLASAVRLHCALQLCSSLAAQHWTKLVGVHCVVHSEAVTSLQLADALMSMLPQAEIPASAMRGAANKDAKLSARMDTGRMSEWDRFMRAPKATNEPASPGSSSRGRFTGFRVSAGRVSSNAPRCRTNATTRVVAGCGDIKRSD
jgi:hypothetical protein